MKGFTCLAGKRPEFIEVVFVQDEVFGQALVFGNQRTVLPEGIAVATVYPKVKPERNGQKNGCHQNKGSNQDLARFQVLEHGVLNANLLIERAQNLILQVRILQVALHNGFRGFPIVLPVIGKLKNPGHGKQIPLARSPERQGLNPRAQ